MSVFIPAQKKKVLGYDIRTMMGNHKKVGQIGLEIECEGNHFYKGESRLEPYWRYVEDHSLRGMDNAEYVLSNPIFFDDVPHALDHLWRIFEKDGTILDESNRTSVHVHLNVQKWCVNRLTSFCAMFFALEEILAEWAGDHRVGNLFCLRAKDAPYIVTAVKTFVTSDGNYNISDNLHYAGLNIQALQKFGSLENRYLRGATDPEVILNWVNINRRLYEYSEQFVDPREVCHAFSYGGPMSFFRTMLGDMADIVLNGISWSEAEVAQSLYEGIRIAQDLCFCRDWSLFESCPSVEDPFGRVKKMVLSSSSSDVQLTNAFEDFINFATNNPVVEVIYDPEPPHETEEEINDSW